MGLFSTIAKIFQPNNSKPKADANQQRSPNVLFNYDLASVELAVIQHEQGNFQYTSALYDALDRDDRVNSCLNTRELAVTGLPFDWIPAENPGDTQRAFKNIKDQWPVFFSQEAQRQVIRTTSVMGFCVASINGWKNNQPYIDPWHPRWISYDITRDCFMAETTFEDKRGNQYYDRVPVTPGDGTWILFKNRFNRPWMGGSIRVLPQLVVYRQANMIDWGRHGKRHGNPPVVVESTDIRSAKIDDYRRLADQLQELVGDSVIMLPNGAKTSLLELSRDAYKVFQAFGPEFLDQAIAIAILGQNLTTSSQGAGGLGSNVSTTQNLVRQDYIESDVTLLGISHKQACWPFYLYQHGIRELAKVPKPFWDARPPEDAKVAAETAKAKADAWNSGLAAIEKAKQMGYKVNEQEALKQIGLPMMKLE